MTNQPRWFWEDLQASWTWEVTFGVTEDEVLLNTFEIGKALFLATWKRTKVSIDDWIMEVLWIPIARANIADVAFEHISCGCDGSVGGVNNGECHAGGWCRLGSRKEISAC